MNGSWVTGVIVWTPAPGMSKTIVSAPAIAFASMIACRSEPAPKSSVLMTVNVAPDTETDEQTVIGSSIRRVENFIETPPRCLAGRYYVPGRRKALQKAVGCKALF